MQPPIHQGTPDAKAQLADWQELAYFDHRAECDAVRERGLKAHGSSVPSAATGPTPNTVQMSQGLAESSVCVAANDPRINWFHWPSGFPGNILDMDGPV